MNKGLPAIPLFATVVATGMINILAGYLIAQATAPGRVPVVPLPLVIGAGVIGIVATIVAVRSWKAHFRGKRTQS